MQPIEKFWLRGKDLNLRPLGYEPNELPDCSTPQHHRNARRPPGQLLEPMEDNVFSSPRMPPPVRGYTPSGGGC